ncbi:MAG TPA: MCE family protein [Actinomycetota bacterium]|nr:MCE family protein [Actinomycetota bacterium]
MTRSNPRLGIVALVLLTAATALLYLFVAGSFKPGYRTTATFERAGQLLRAGSDVKMRGVLVGEVETIAVLPDGTARVGMRILPEHEIAQNVNAAIRAKTLFGEKYVDLIVPEEPSGRLGEGDEIPLERTIGPIEVETILERGVPLLAAIDPQNLAAAMQTLVQAFAGNEEALRRATVQGVDLLEGTRETLPEFERNLQHLDTFSRALDEADEDLLRAMDGLERVGGTTARNAEQLRALLRHLPSVSRDLGDILSAREPDLADLATQGAPVLEVVAAKADSIPRLLQLTDGFLGMWIVNLSAGPYWRIFVTDEPPHPRPYPPGEEPRPRMTTTAAERRALLRDVGAMRRGEVPALPDALLAPIAPDRARELLGVGP